MKTRLLDVGDLCVKVAGERSRPVGLGTEEGILLANCLVVIGSRSRCPASAVAQAEKQARRLVGLFNKWPLEELDPPCIQALASNLGIDLKTILKDQDLVTDATVLRDRVSEAVRKMRR